MRDRIPQIIRASGAEPMTYQADPAEYRRRLRDKLAVVYALAADLGTTEEALETTRAAKARERGAFTDRTIWTGIR
ncbi:nucleoside triphosphate pyrophosphohydrolase [Kribbella sp. C-35]|uniref:nucleoside triphosphate pyrophosphohydrolase n=1 Tax=Kribbella sp. C-35 TaxID=2789276 RepID=UPI00397CAA57